MCVGKLIRGDELSSAQMTQLTNPAHDRRSLSSMVSRLLRAMGAPPASLAAYQRKPLHDLSHAMTAGSQLVSSKQ